MWGNKVRVQDVSVRIVFACLLHCWAGQDVQLPSPFTPTLVRLASKRETTTVLQWTHAGSITSVMTPTGNSGFASRKLKRENLWHVCGGIPALTILLLTDYRFLQVCLLSQTPLL